MSFSAYGDSDNLPSSWPAGLKYNPNAAKYLFSSSNAFQIAALEHIHVIAIDVAPPPPPGFNVMTLTLPIQKNLPLESRMYYFYVSLSNVDDVLTFIPVSGSGDTINGSPFSWSATLVGTPQLFIALGVNGNYIIHEFGNTHVPLPPIVSDPLNMFKCIQPVGSSAVSVYNYHATIKQGPNQLSYYTSDAYNPTFDVDNYIPGMDNYITPVAAVPISGLPGFIVNHTGLYRITYDHTGLEVTGANVSTVLNRTVLLVNTLADGTVVQHFAGGASANVLTTITSSSGNCVRTMKLDADTYLVGAIGLPDAYSVGLIYRGPASGAVDFSTMTFELLVDLEVAPLLAMTAFELSARSAGSTSEVVESPMHAPASKVQIKKVQDAARNRIVRSTLGSGQQQQQQLPSFTLTDMERMINQALNARDARSSQSGSMLPISSFSSSSGKEQEIVISCPDPKKRKLSEVAAKKH